MVVGDEGGDIASNQFEARSKAGIETEGTGNCADEYAAGLLSAEIVVLEAAEGPEAAACCADTPGKRPVAAGGVSHEAKAGTEAEVSCADEPESGVHAEVEAAVSSADVPVSRVQE